MGKKGASYTILLDFDFDDFQTESIYRRVFAPLCLDFHVAACQSFREKSLKELRAVLEDVTTRYAPFMVEPAAYPYVRGSVGVPIYIITNAFNNMVEEIEEKYPRFQANTLHATLQACSCSWWYNNNYATWYRKEGRRCAAFQMRVVGLRIVQNCKWRFKDIEVFTFRGQQRRRRRGRGPG